MKLAFIGVGRMGHAMVARLLAAGHEVAVYNRTPDKIAPLVALGAHAVDSIADAAGYAGIVLSMLSDDTALMAVAAADHGLLHSLPADGIHVAMGTHDVKAVRALAASHTAGGQHFLSAPVLGRPEAVTAGRLGIVVGGAPAAVARCMPIFESLGRRVFTAGDEPGTAATMKLANNCMLACAIEALGEAFTLVEKNGGDVHVFQEMITDGLFASPAYTTYSKIIVDKAWDNVGFTVALALKDINLALAAGGGVSVPMPSANVCRDRLLGAVSHGDAQRDWAAMALEQARASGLV